MSSVSFKPLGNPLPKIRQGINNILKTTTCKTLLGTFSLSVLRIAYVEGKEGEALSIFRLREMKALGQGYLAIGCGVRIKTGLLELQGTTLSSVEGTRSKPWGRPRLSSSSLARAHTTSQGCRWDFFNRQVPQPICLVGETRAAGQGEMTFHFLFLASSLPQTGSEKTLLLPVS